MRNINVQGNVVKSRKFGFFVQEFRLHWLATMIIGRTFMCNPCCHYLSLINYVFCHHRRSRLGCQIIVSKDIDNIRLKVPEGTTDVREL